MENDESGERHERALRERLGIPASAEKVLIFGETSHWDPNWLYTSKEYYARRIERILDDVLEALRLEPRRVFSVEALFFLRMYFEKRPDRRETIRELVNNGRLRLTGTGLTTPDTVLPKTESIFRDYLLGRRWLVENGMNQEPTLAYLPDDFGCSPALPSMCRAMGYNKIGVTRIDGMYFVGTDLRPRSAFPLPGSSAELLAKTLRTCDFVWRGPDGSEALCHWNAFNYFQGDMLAHLGIIRWMGRVYGVSSRSRRHVARRLRRYVSQLAPLSRTPYMFCPIGCDFNSPIKGLCGLLDRYNERDAEHSGVFAVVATMEDYLDLVDCYRDSLPTLELDPNPYWMGFYASRPEAKRACNRIVRKLIEAEKLLFLGGDGPSRGQEDPFALQRDLDRGWELSALANHHDFITGTSPDRVWNTEQLPWLREAEQCADRVIEEAVKRAEPAPVGQGRSTGPRWRFEDGVLDVQTKTLRLKISEKSGGCFEYVAARTTEERRLLNGPANDVIAYRDTGGLWRMGHEFLGGAFEEKERASLAPTRLSVEEKDGLLEVRAVSSLGKKPLERICWIQNDEPIIRMRLRGAALARRTVTCRFPTAVSGARLQMNVPGGIAERPVSKGHAPTFWPARSWLHLRDDYDDWGVAAFLGGPATAALTAEGVLEVVAFRNVSREIAYGFLPILAHPASGTDPHEGIFDYALMFTSAGGCVENRLPALSRRVLRDEWLYPELPQIKTLAGSAVQVDREDVLVSAVKPADIGEGVVVRLTRLGSAKRSVRVTIPTRRLRRAFLCDALERDLQELSCDEDGLTVALERGNTSLRLLFVKNA